MEVMKELKDIVDPVHTALIVIDVQHDFCSSQGFMAKHGMDVSRVQAAVPRLNRFVEECRKYGVSIIWVKEIWARDKMLPNLLSQFDEECLGEHGLIVEGTHGTEYYEELIPSREQEPLVIKWNYDAFDSTELDLILRSNGIKTLLMAGFISNCCVETTARHGFIKGYYIVMLSDCTDTYSKMEHDAAISNIKNYFGRVASSKDIVSLWVGVTPVD